jgi:hypothetical protein
MAASPPVPRGTPLPEGEPLNEASRTQGLLICAGAVAVGIVFLLGLLTRSWWAVALPVGALLAVVLGLAFWVGWTIATVQVEPEADPDAAPEHEGEPGPADRAA